MHILGFRQFFYGRNKIMLLLGCNLYNDNKSYGCLLEIIVGVKIAFFEWGL